MGKKKAAAKSKRGSSKPEKKQKRHARKASGSAGSVTGPGTLTIVGTGIRAVGQMTVEAIGWIRGSDKVLYLASDPLVSAIFQGLNPGNCESLADAYEPGRNRGDSIRELAERMLVPVRQGYRTCVALLGHPGVFCVPAHQAIRQARQEGFAAAMLPGISSEDCLFADLGVDPGTHGCQSYEAMDFLLNARGIDPRSHVILWQIGVMGDPEYRPRNYNLCALPVLIERLLKHYPADHPVTIYSASAVESGKSHIDRVVLSDLHADRLHSGCTLYIPPSQPTLPDPDVVERLRAIGFPVDVHLNKRFPGGG